MNTWTSNWDHLIGRTDPGSLVQAITYDVAGQRKTLTDPDGGVRTYMFDLESRIATLQFATGGVTTFGYDAASRTISETYATGAQVLRGFDAASQITTTIWLYSGTAQNSATVTYDPNGSRPAFYDIFNDFNAFTMDAKDRLTGAHRGLSITPYAYDHTDNITQNGLESLTYDLASGLNTSSPTVMPTQITTYTVDLNGNLTSVNANGSLYTMAYDYENRLAVYAHGSSVTSFLYSADNLKRVENAGGTLTTLVWDGSSYLQGRTGATDTNYYSVGSRLLGEATSGAELTYMSDALGSTIGTISTAGVRNKYAYSAYGSLAQSTTPDPSPKFLWNGKTGSRATGLTYAENYNRLHHYSETTAQWTTRDPLWPGQHPFGYVGQRPVTRRDPMGLQYDSGPGTTPLRGPGPWQSGQIWVGPGGGSGWSPATPNPFNPFPGGIPTINMPMWPPFGTVVITGPCGVSPSGGGGWQASPGSPFGPGGSGNSGGFGDVNGHRRRAPRVPGCDTPGPLGACIAALCAGDASFKWFHLLQDILEALEEEAVLGLIGSWGFWEGGLHGDLGLNSLNPNPGPCCEDAWAGGGNNLVARLIGSLCRTMLDTGRQPCLEMPSAKSCKACCLKSFNGVANEYERTCEGSCDSFWIEE